MTLHTLGVIELIDAIRRGTTNALEVTECFIARIDQHGDALNAFITVDADAARAQANAADSHAALGGVPLAHKDIFCTRGLATTCGSRMLENFISPYDATIIERLHDAGAVVLGKTNMDEFAMGSSSETSYFGVVRNPWATHCVPGGSSGGSAAAVAAGLAPAATGTDTGGSIRQPAAFCGLTGVKPSYGRVSRYGMIAFASSLDQGGTLTRSAADAAVLLQQMCGFDPRDSTSLDEPVPDFSARLDRDIDGLTIGLPKQFFGPGVAADVARATDAALQELVKLGARLQDIELPNSTLAVPCYYVLAPAEASSNLSRYDGVRYGFRTDRHTDLADLYKKTRAQGFGAEVKRRIMIGTHTLSSGYYDAYYLKAQKIRRLICADFDQAFKQCDIIMGPTTPTTAFELGAKTRDPIAMYLNDIFTIPANLAGLPAMSIPAGFGDDGCPVGLHLMGRYFDEPRILNVAHRYQQVTDWHVRRPEAFR